MTRRLLNTRAVPAVLLCLVLAWACSAPAPDHAPAGTAARIVSLVPAATEMLFAIGAGPEVVGVSSFDEYPPEVLQLPKLGALVDPDFERILTLQPTLVVVYDSQDDLVARLERSSIRAFRFRHAVEDSLADITRTMRVLGRETGHQAQADREAVRIEGELDDVRARVAGRSRPSTALVFGREPGALRGIYVSGGRGFLHDLLETAGASNVFGDLPRQSLQISSEALLQRAPAAIIELRTASSPSAEQMLRERAIWNQLPSIPAIRNDRVYLLTEESLSIPGPRIGVAARVLMSVLHPDAQ